MTKYMLRKLADFVDEYWSAFVTACDGDEVEAENIREAMEEMQEG